MRRAAIVAALCLGACTGAAVPPPSIERPNETPELTPPPPSDKSNLIRVRKPKEGARVTSPLHVTGEARGTWYFEATFPIALLDPKGRELARSYATAQGEWMTDEFVPFEGDLVFAAGDAKTGTLVLEKANPAGSLDQADQLLVPVRLR